jgi:alpha-L-fucosidase 2
MRALLKRRFAIIAAGLLFPLIPGAQAEPAESKLWHDKPAGHWLEALPVGNGRMGAMVFGGASNERIQFNEQTLWTGINASQKLFGHNIGDGAMGDYQPFGDVFLRFPEEHAKHTGFRRELDLRTAIATTRYQVRGVTFTREVFASHPDRVVVMRLTADKAAGLSFQIALKDVQRRQRPPVATNVSEAIHELSFSGKLSRPPKAQAGDLRWNDMAYQASLRVIADGGEVTGANGELAVTNADAVTILLAAATDYDRDPNKKFRGEAPAPKVAAALHQAAKKPYTQLRADHVADHQSLFGRVSLDLGDHDRNALPTDRRLIEYKSGKRDNALEALLFNFGRYVTIASVRPGGLPANLQGLWNDNPAPAWYSGYTHNMNVQMNNWLTETANLPECAEPLFDWIENIELGTRLNPDPRLRTDLGWIMYSTHNPVGGNSGWGLHRPGSAWLSQHFWEHYAFGGDKEFLRKRAYPQLRELTRMWDARLIDGPDGKLVTPDGWSPEHAPVRGPDGKITIKEGDRTPLPGVSYDQQIIWDLFTNFIEASRTLGVDDELRARITERRARLLGPKVGRWGQIQEWMEDVDDPKLVYRHIGHLFGLHPGRQISPVTMPEWAKAAKVTLDAQGDKSVGWSRAWKICFRARLHDGEAAARVVRSVLEYVPAKTNGSGTHPNLFGAGPPFQMDANFGYTAGVAEMLVQSHIRSEDGRREIHLLPALPDSWPSGEVTGLRARDGFTVDQKWVKGTLVSATITSKLGRPFRIRYQGKTTDFDIPAGASPVFKP